MSALIRANVSTNSKPFVAQRRVVISKAIAAETTLKTTESERVRAPSCTRWDHRYLIYQGSGSIFSEAQDLLPGGVNSPVRAFKSVGGVPIVFDRVKGSKVYDVDGNEFIDYVGTWGPAIVGHANDEVLDAIKEQLEKGTSYGAPCELENVMAKMVIDRMPCADMVRFCSSGTEACISALRLMRAYTGREKVIKFVGCFHGHGDAFLVQAGSGVATLGLPDSPGVPQGSTSGTLCATYNNLESVKAIFEANKDEIAGVILEPIVGNSGYIEPTPEFLKGLREMCTQEGALLCFDEVRYYLGSQMYHSVRKTHELLSRMQVMTGFRVARNSAQGHFGVTPDMCTMGKVIGGGLPVGAFGGRRDVMETVAPAGPMYQSGTLSGNPLAMVSGMKTLEIMDRPGSYEHLDTLCKKLVAGILALGEKHNIPVVGGSVGGMFGFFFSEVPITCFEDAAAHGNAERFAKYHRMMLERGVYTAPSMYEAGFVSLAHTDADIDKTLEAMDDVFSKL